MTMTTTTSSSPSLLFVFQVRILDCRDGKASAQLVRAREPGIEYYIEHCHGVFYILTNYPDGENYQVRVLKFTANLS